jgi:hypothetical protein
LRRSNPTAASSHFRHVVELLTPRQDPQSPFLAKARADLARSLALANRR